MTGEAGTQSSVEEPSRVSKKNRHRSSRGDAEYFKSSIDSDTGYDADVDVVKPYEIEEPDDDDTQSQPALSIPSKLLPAADQWQQELVCSMEQLRCKSDNLTDSSASLVQKRGRKRRPSSSSTSLSMCARNNVPGEGACGTPKRLRRRSRRSTKVLGTSVMMYRTSPMYPSWESSSDTSSSSASRSIRKAEGKPVRESIAMDEMDID